MNHANPHQEKAMSPDQAAFFKKHGFERGPAGGVVLRTCQIAVYVVESRGDIRSSFGVYVRHGEAAGAFWRDVEPIVRKDSLAEAINVGAGILGIVGCERFVKVITADGSSLSGWRVDETETNPLKGEPVTRSPKSNTVPVREVPVKLAALRELHAAGKGADYYDLAHALHNTADKLTREHTAFSGIEDMVASAADHGYKPSVQTSKHPSRTALADLFDAICELRGIASRAYRY
jgi:hypothetical protein